MNFYNNKDTKEIDIYEINERMENTYSSYIK